MLYMASILNTLKKVVDPNEREVGRLAKKADMVIAFEDRMRKLSDEELAALTPHFRERLANGETLDSLLPEAFAAVREAADRALGERPFKVQIMGGVALHMGMVAEMKTGEGKTLVATLPLYLNALPGKGAHLVTTNDFLVRTGAEWMGQVFARLGMSAGYIQQSMSAAERRVNYRKDVTYVENSQLGFDYLRDNMATSPAQLTQRELHYAIVDEADSILIDEARTPLIISGEAQSKGADYEAYNKLTERLIRANAGETEEEAGALFLWDKKDHQAALTEAGMIWVENQLGMKDTSLVDAENLEIRQLIDNSLKAHFLYDKDHEYVVQNGEVVIVDEFTGHLQPGRRYSDGIHQAIEAKEHVYTPRVRQTVASITYQNFFRLYDKIAGMTGTAKSEEQEFVTVYGARVVVIPTNKPIARIDHPDVIYKTEEAKYRGIINDIIGSHVRLQPTLVGTRSVDVSEHIGQRLSEAQLQTHALTQILLHRIYDDNKLDRETRDQWNEILRRPIAELINQAMHLRRHGKTDEPTIGDMLEHYAIEPDLDADANIDAMLEIVGAKDKDISPEQLAEYRTRLRTMLAKGLMPGDGQHESVLNLLNAKRHDSEGRIIAQAGRPGMITIATNMAGRGVDIRLGGRDPETGEVLPEAYALVKQLGGLHVIGSERHESRRIDNQLRGRSGRQGDEGSSRFYVSLEDELMRFFGTERVSGLMAGWPDEDPIAHSFVSKTLERAQMKVEMRYMGIRKNTLRYDDVMNTQRSVIYEQRRRVLDGENVHPYIMRMIERTVTNVLAHYADVNRPSEEWDLEALFSQLRRVVSVPPEAELDDNLEIPANGISMKLAALHIAALIRDGADLRTFLADTAEPYGELSRAMERPRAERQRRDVVENDAAAIIQRFSIGGAPTPARALDIVRALGSKYAKAVDDIAIEGLYSIHPRELNDVIPQMALEVYTDRELGLIDTRIIQGTLRLACNDIPRGKWNIPALEGFLFGYLHELRPRLALERVRALKEADGADWLVQRTLKAYQQVAETPARAEQAAIILRDKNPGILSDPQVPSEQQIADRVNALQIEFGGNVDLHRWDLPSVITAMDAEFPAFSAILADEQLLAMADEAGDLAATLMDFVREETPEGTPQIGYREFRYRERSWLLAAVDKSWMAHLLDVDELREGIHLRAHAQRDPLVEYQREASILFENMMEIIARRLTQYAFTATNAMEDAGTQVRDMQATQSAVDMTDAADGPQSPMPDTRPAQTFVADDEPGRNDPCPCGSGKKYKKCCMLKK